MRSPAYVWRVFTALIVVVVLGLVGQRLMRPASFGQIGHYRANSLAEIVSLEPVHQGKEVCRECHEKIWATHEKDIHFSVECEDCHGAANVHVKYHRGEVKLVSKEEAQMPKKYTLEGCLFCHRKLYSRPRTFAQIDPVEHYKFLGVTGDETRCTECHSPHEPLFLQDEVKKARIHPVIYECEDCHDSRPEKEIKDVANHPTVFVCRDCHQPVVEDFKKHEHSFMRCTTCHLYYRESETSGRIFKNSNQRFCLLCHERKPFKDPNVVPQIDFEKHIQAMAPIVHIRPDELKDNTMVCLKCHFDFVHDNGLIKRIRGFWNYEDGK